MMLRLLGSVFLIILLGEHEASAVIPGHREDVINTLRWLMGKHYYPTTASRLSDDLSASVCVSHSALTLASTQQWSYDMWDASGKIPDGAAAGATEARGHPETCEGVGANFPGTLESHLFPHRHFLSARNISLQDLHPGALQKRDTSMKGKYCLVSVRGGNAKGLGAGGSSQLLASLAGKYANTYATCIPSTCTSKILQESLQTVQEDGSWISVICDGEVKEDEVTTSEWSFLTVTVVLLGLAVAAGVIETQYPCTRTQNGCDCSAGRKLLHCFSFSQNSQKLFSFSTTPASFQTLDGLRVVCMIWVIATHRYMFFLISSANPNDILKHMTNWRYSWVFNAYPSVDTFLFVSAFLVSVILKQRLKQFTFAGFYLQRYLRLIPAMVYMIWGCSTVLRYLGSGVVWSRTHYDMFSRPCTQTAHHNILFVNNLNDSNDMCMGHLWSLAVEWQLYLVTPLILLPLYWYPTHRFRWAPLLAFFAISVLTPAAVTVIGDLPPTASFWDYEASQRYYNTNYITSWCRAAPYCIGLAAGYLYHWMDENHITLSTMSVRVGKVLSTLIGVAVMVGPSFLMGHGKYWAALYSSLSRPAWGLMMSFIVINACKGKPGFWVWLSSRSWVTPLCRVSYCMFLVSLPLQTMAAARTQKQHYDHLSGLYLVIGDLVLSYFAAVVLHLLVESPFSRAVGLMLSGKLSRKSKTPSDPTRKNATLAEQRAPLASRQQLVLEALSAESGCTMRNRNI